jgi:Egh16-like virulence factor
MPAGVTCNGTVGSTTNACLVQCMNPVGPFGSNVIVQTATANQTNKYRFVMRGTLNRWQ